MLTTKDYLGIQWTVHPSSPLISPPFPSPIVADPTFLFPSQSPDGQWHLFAHSLKGIHHFTSSNGLKWQRQEIAVRNGMRAFIFRQDEAYYLLYESIRHAGFPWQWLPGRKWASAIEVVRSRDLRHWSPPTTLLEPTVPWQQDASLGNSVGNPCLTAVEDGYRLYFSGGLTYLPDCGFCEPTNVGVAFAASIMGPYEVRSAPIIEPTPDSAHRNLAAGAMKVLPASDGWVGFQNGIYWDDKMKRSGSAILLLASRDGLEWRQIKEAPILAPGDGWMRSHVYALDVHQEEGSGQFYLYFNARSGWHWTRGVERIGLLVGTLPAQRRA